MVFDFDTKFSSRRHRLQFCQRLAADLNNERSGDIVFAVEETTAVDQATSPSSEYKFLYAWKHCLLATGRDTYFGKRSAHRHQFTDNSI